MTAYKSFEEEDHPIFSSNNDLNNTTIVQSNNDTQVIDDFSRADIPHEELSASKAGFNTDLPF